MREISARGVDRYIGVSGVLPSEAARGRWEAFKGAGRGLHRTDRKNLQALLLSTGPGVDHVVAARKSVREGAP
ncbi:hypothetical protein GCM10018773_06050 [Streptomyces candidus]|nr:hypothetical protein GCM10018773_06050 [Streptomyces candidus]